MPIDRSNQLTEFEPIASNVIRFIQSYDGIEANGQPARKRINGYGILFRHHCVLVDLLSHTAIDDLHRLARAGKPPRALIITKACLISPLSSEKTFADTFSIPVLLHPDGMAPDATGHADPATDATLRQDNIETLLKPGGGPGEIIVYSSRDGGVLFANGLSFEEARAAIGGRPLQVLLSRYKEPMRSA